MSKLNVIALLFVSSLLASVFANTATADEIKTISALGPFGDAKLVAVRDSVGVLANIDNQLHYSKIVNDDLPPFQQFSPNISATWFAYKSLDSSRKKYLIVASSFDARSVRFYLSNMEVLDSVVLYEFSPKCDLNIDPTIERVESTVFVTYTCIVGAVNRRDLKTKNGLYQVSLLKADISDLRKWDEVSIVLSEYNNIEDGILQYDPVTKTLNYIYESELLDQKHSGIFLKISRDMGVTWAPPIQLISMDSDNEPAAVLTKATQHKLYFSSDRNSPGTSYAGGEIFVKSFSFDWSRSSKIRLLELGKQMLLMDVIAFEDKTYFLTIKNYFHTPRQLEVLRLQN